MTLAELTALVDYHYGARDRVLAACEPLTPEQFTRSIDSSYGSVRDTLAHLCGADWVWCSRWLGESPTALPDRAPFADLASIRAAWLAEEQRVRAVLAGLGDSGIRQPIAYRLFSGAAGAEPFWQQLQHLVNHGSYHRGQITTLLRQLGVPPPKPLDLIGFYCERAAADV